MNKTRKARCGFSQACSHPEKCSCPVSETCGGVFKGRLPLVSFRTKPKKRPSFKFMPLWRESKVGGLSFEVIFFQAGLDDMGTRSNGYYNLVPIACPKKDHHVLSSFFFSASERNPFQPIACHQLVVLDSEIF